MTQPAPDAVAVVTVNWNGWRNTLACLAALRASANANWHLIIVDNASSDASLEHLRGLGDDVTLIESPVNGGWTGGNNVGVAHALAGGWPFVFVLNNDAFVEPDTLRTLRAVHAEVGGRAAIGPVHLTSDGTAFDFVGMVDDPETGFPHWLPTDAASVATLPDPMPAHAIKGAGIFIDSASLRETGSFDDRFYLNWDEIDWAYTARARGIRLFMTQRARIVHAGSASIGGLDSPLHTYFMARNSLLFAEKHCSAHQRIAHMRRLFWEARRRARAHRPGKRWLGGFLTSRTADERAFKRALIDYTMRRFGDCPPLIRELNRRP